MENALPTTTSAHGEILEAGKPFYEVGEVINFNCKNGATIGPKSATCQENGLFSVDKFSCSSGFLF